MLRDVVWLDTVAGFVMLHYIIERDRHTGYLVEFATQVSRGHIVVYMIEVARGKKLDSLIILFVVPVSECTQGVVGGFG